MAAKKIKPADFLFLREYTLTDSVIPDKCTWPGDVINKLLFPELLNVANLPFDKSVELCVSSYASDKDVSDLPFPLKVQAGIMVFKADSRNLFVRWTIFDSAGKPLAYNPADDEETGKRTTFYSGSLGKPKDYIAKLKELTLPPKKSRGAALPS